MKYPQKILDIPLAIPDEYKDILYPIFTFSNKTVLGGSLVLHMLNILPIENFKQRQPDFDFSLTSPLNKDELSYIKDFLNLEFSLINGYYGGKEKADSDMDKDGNLKPISHFLKKELIQLTNHPNNWGERYIKIDFFNDSYIKKRDIFYMEVDGFKLRLAHPSLIISHKAKYAYDIRVGKNQKHMQDLKKINLIEYDNIIRNITFTEDKFEWKIYPTNHNPSKIWEYV